MVVVWVRSETREAGEGHEARKRVETGRRSDFERQSGPTRGRYAVPVENERS
jgi:hypothetical protein